MLVYEQDWREVDLKVGGEVKLRFAVAYGFRNIQKVIRLMKSKRCHYHYIEVLACPGGCLNGGGQLKHLKSFSTKSSANRISLNRMKSLFHKDLIQRDPDQGTLCKSVYRALDTIESKMTQHQANSASNHSWLHTKYHPVSDLDQANPIGIQW